MHELSLCQSIIEIINQEAKTQNFQKVLKVVLELGEFAGVEKSALEFGFEVASQETIAEGAVLEIEDVPGSAKCKNCNKTVKVKHLFQSCPECGEFNLEILSGRELRIKNMDVE